CHHLHTNKALHLPLDPQQHTRFNCDNCDHPILGIGRTSTQTTLASIETNAAGQRSWPSEAEATSALVHQPIPVPVQSPPLRVDTSGNSGPLSTIAEGVSPAQQSSAALTPAVSGDSRSEVSSSHERPPTRQVPTNEKQETFEDSKTDKNGHVRTDDISTPSGGFWIRQSRRRFRERIRQHLWKPRSFNFSKLGLHVDVSPTPSAPGRPSLPVTSALPTSTWDPGNDPTSVSIANSEPIANLTSGLSSPVRSNPVSLHSAEPSQQPASAHPDPLIGRTWTLPEKHERIRALRREATLKRQAELISRCECQSECQCRNGSVQSNAASLGAEPSERSIQVPAHPLHRLLGETGGSSTSESSSSGVNGGSFLVGIGSHLPQEQVFPLVDRWTSQTPEYQQLFSDRVSQASTAPTDACWPSLIEWNLLNRTIAGKMIRNVQPAAACYPGPEKDNTECDYVNSQWRSQDFQSSTPIGLSYPTESCPVLNLTAGQQPAQNCTLGDQPVYSVNAMDASDVSKGIRFAKRHNLRLVIRDTGHDLLRRTGIEFQQTFTPSSRCPKSTWKGSAFQIGGGYTWSDILDEAARRDVVVVGGGTPSVGCLGGWMQGGGHGPAAHDFGLGADQVLEAKIVLANGRVVTANPCQHSDLFFAIRGGGGGTYGVVISTTVKAHPTNNVAAQQLSFAPLDSSYMPEFMKAVELVHNAYPDLSDQGFSGYGSWALRSPTPLVYNYDYTLGEDVEAAANFTTGFTHTIAIFGKSATEAETIFAPIAANLTSSFGKTLFFNTTYSSFQTYAAYYTALSGITSPIGSSAALGSRLLDREALTSPRLGETLRKVVGEPEEYTSMNIVFVGGGQVARDGEDKYS
ncbi:MAG: hypothetical protein Q9226_007428, partial [Calogaya cf. arnoldii]